MEPQEVLIEDEKIIKDFFEQSKRYLLEDFYEIEIDYVFNTDLKLFKITSIPNDIRIMIVDKIGFFWVNSDGINDIYRCWSINVDGWTKDYSASYYCRNIIEYMKKNEDKYKIKYENFEADGVLHDIWYYYTDFNEKSIEQSINHIKLMEEEISGIINLQLNERGIETIYFENEEKFTMGLLLPLFRSMDFNDVFYNHGRREFGKDIIFTVNDVLGIKRIFGVQVKMGDLSGEANSDIDKIIGQIDDVFSIPFINKYTKEKKFITDLLIIVSGRYTNNAVEKIMYKVNNSNVFFWDIDKINELISKHIL